jgi:hypothetical protein
LYIIFRQCTRLPNFQIFSASRDAPCRLTFQSADWCTSGSTGIPVVRLVCQSVDCHVSRRNGVYQWLATQLPVRRTSIRPNGWC